MIIDYSIEEFINKLFSTEEEEPKIEYSDKQQKIARICHNINRLCSIMVGSDENAKDWDNAPKNQKSSCLEGVVTHLENPDLSPEESHKKWMEYKKENGWKYGTEKDATAKTHPRLVEYDKLPKAEKLKDAIFATLVKELNEIL